MASTVTDLSRARLGCGGTGDLQELRDAIMTIQTDTVLKF